MAKTTQKGISQNLSHLPLHPMPAVWPYRWTPSYFGEPCLSVASWLAPSLLRPSVPVKPGGASMVLGPFAETKGPRPPGRNPAFIISINNCGLYMGNHKVPISSPRIRLHMRCLISLGCLWLTPVPFHSSPIPRPFDKYMLDFNSRKFSPISKIASIQTIQ